MVDFNIINAIEKATNLKVKALRTKEIEECIIYDFNTITNDGVKRLDRLTLRIFSNSMKKCEEIGQKIEKILLKIGDGSNFDNVTNIILNGDGYLEDFETDYLQKIQKFIITKRSC